jgi:methionine-rich copper-binding protein CopC
LPRLFRLAPILAALVLAPALAQAHAILVQSNPAVGGTTAPGKVAMEFRFNSRIDRERSRLTLTAPDHSQSVLPIAPEGPPDILDTSANLTPGSYVVRWQVLAIDGHITRGDVTFTVGK